MIAAPSQLHLLRSLSSSERRPERLQLLGHLPTTRDACPDPSMRLAAYTEARIMATQTKPARPFVPTQHKAVCFCSLTREGARLVGSQAGPKQNVFSSRQGNATPHPWVSLCLLVVTCQRLVCPPSLTSNDSGDNSPHLTGDGPLRRASSMTSRARRR